MNEELHHVADCLFKASENIREALDTIDIKNLPFDGSLLVALESCSNFLEEHAQRTQKKISN